ncbi:hypothetical protein Pelo_163 [Pelomyxa schiedti]|nr:hypothetical protein Pelo_163 [Pelomyxa schiedti]
MPGINEMHVDVFSPSFLGGDMVSGNVIIQLGEEFPAVNDLVIVLSGAERVMFQEKQSQSQSSSTSEGDDPGPIKTQQIKNTLFSNRKMLMEIHGPMSAGRYIIPFMIPLPPNLPCTCKFNGGDWKIGTGFKAMVSFKVKAILAGISPQLAGGASLRSATLQIRPTTTTAPKIALLQHRVRLVVNEHLDRVKMINTCTSTRPFHKGELSMTASLDNHTYFPGERILVKLNVNSSVTKPTSSINVHVDHTLDMCVGDGAMAHTKQLRTKVAGGIQHHPPFEPCYLGTRYIPFSLPTTLQPSTKSKHIKSSYELIVELEVPGNSIPIAFTLLAPHFMFGRPSIPMQQALSSLGNQSGLAVSPVSTGVTQAPSTPIPPEIRERPSWQPDSQATGCNQCGLHFSVLTRKHHCRHCAMIFCNKCAARKTPIANLKYTNAVRVCDTCFPAAQRGGVKRSFEVLQHL